MTDSSHLSGLFLAKIIFGILAITFNAICVFAVFKRYKYVQLLDTKGMDSAEPFMKLGGLVIPAFLVTLGISVYFVLSG